MKRMLRCLLAVVCTGAAEASALDDEKKPVPLYTNEDLQRVSPYRDETGGSSKPAAAPAPEPASERGRARGEEYWRREAERVRDRLRPLRERASEARRDTALLMLLLDTGARRAEMVGLQLADVDLELDVLLVLGKGRRERALPGWIR